MSDNTSIIDAVRLLAKATKEDSAKLSDIVKGALHPDQIDDMRLMHAFQSPRWFHNPWSRYCFGLGR